MADLVETMVADHDFAEDERYPSLCDNFGGLGYGTE
jgi:hypothetical protein